MLENEIFSPSAKKTNVRKNGRSTGGWCLDKAVLRQGRGGGGGTMEEKGISFLLGVSGSGVLHRAYIVRSKPCLKKKWAVPS